MADASTIADQLGAVVPDFDQLVAAAELGPRNGRPDQFLEQLEEHAQRVAAAIVAPFRGAGSRPVCPPLHLDLARRRAVY